MFWPKNLDGDLDVRSSKYRHGLNSNKSLSIDKTPECASRFGLLPSRCRRLNCPLTRTKTIIWTVVNPKYLNPSSLSPVTLAVLLESVSSTHMPFVSLLGRKLAQKIQDSAFLLFFFLPLAKNVELDCGQGSKIHSAHFGLNLVLML